MDLSPKVDSSPLRAITPAADTCSSACEKTFRTGQAARRMNFSTTASPRSHSR